MIDQLELTHTEITQVLQILADSSGWTVIPSREVNGTVSVYLRNISAGDALRQILHNNGFRYIREGDTITVMTEKQYNDRVDSEMTQRVYPLSFARAQKVAGDVQHLLSPEGRALPDMAANQVVVMDRANRFDEVETLIGMLDRRGETRVIALQHATVKELKPIVGSMIAGTGEWVADERTNRFIITNTPERLDQIESTIRRLDLKEIVETRSWRLTHANAEDVADQVEEMISEDGPGNRRISSAGDFAPPDRPAPDAGEIQTGALGIRGSVIADPRTGTVIVTHTPAVLNRLDPLIRAMDQPLRVHTFRFRHADIQTLDVESKLGNFITGDGEGFIVDSTNGQVFFVTGDEKAAQITELLRAWDAPLRQVYVQARILRVTRDMTRDLGSTLQLAFSRAGKSPSPIVDLLFPPDIGDVPKGLLQVGTLADDEFTLIVEALENERLGTLLSNPRLAVLDRQTARFQVAVDRPFVEVVTDANSDITRESTRFIPVGVTLEVVPVITDSDGVKMEVRIEISSLEGTSAGGAPIVDRTEALSNVLVQDGHTLVIGGLIVEDLQDTENKVPFLGDIPIVGHAFKNTRRQDDRSELVLFITPRIMDYGSPEPPPDRLQALER